jgi:hypothetical protein
MTHNKYVKLGGVYGWIFPDKDKRRLSIGSEKPPPNVSPMTTNKLLLVRIGYMLFLMCKKYVIIQT